MVWAQFDIAILGMGNDGHHAAAGWAFLYWALGGSFSGAVVIFIILKLLRK